MVLVRNIRKHPYFDEGHWYNFVVRKEVEMPDGNFAWILVDEEGTQYTLASEYYIDYGINSGDLIQCKVDKINCTGKVYLEPAHPYYKEGRTYDFEVVSKAVLPDIYGDMRIFWTLRDIFGNEMHIPAPADFYRHNLPKTAHCIVLRIRKAQLQLKHVHEIKLINSLFPGNTFDFEVFETSHEHEGESYIILIGPDGSKHLLKQKHYNDYGFETGDHILCEVIGKNIDESLILEPDHPFYKTGLSYSFALAEDDDDLKDYQPSENEIIVKDIYQNLIILEKTESEKSGLFSNRVLRKVLMIRRGIPVLG